MRDILLRSLKPSQQLPEPEEVRSVTWLSDVRSQKPTQPVSDAGQATTPDIGASRRVPACPVPVMRKGLQQSRFRIGQERAARTRPDKKPETQLAPALASVKATRKEAVCRVSLNVHG